MNIHDIFSSKYLTAHDLGGKSFTLTISRVTMEEMRTHDNTVVKKLVIWFDKATKSLVANRTNAMTIANLYGPETDRWVGKRIILYPTQVRAFGSMQDCIRVREEVPAKPQPPTPAAQAEEVAGLDDDEDVADVPNDDLWEPDLSQPGSPLGAPSNSRRKERITPVQLERVQTLLRKFYGTAWEAEVPRLSQHYSQGAASRLEDLVLVEYEKFVTQLERTIETAEKQAATWAVTA